LCNGEVAPGFLLRLPTAERLKKDLTVKAGLRCDIGEDLLIRDITVLGIERCLDAVQTAQGIGRASAAHPTTARLAGSVS
jgi:hypothetical protein